MSWTQFELFFNFLLSTVFWNLLSFVAGSMNPSKIYCGHFNSSQTLFSLFAKNKLVLNRSQICCVCVKLFLVLSQWSRTVPRFIVGYLISNTSFLKTFLKVVAGEVNLSQFSFKGLELLSYFSYLNPYQFCCGQVKCFLSLSSWTLPNFVVGVSKTSQTPLNFVSSNLNCS